MINVYGKKNCMQCEELKKRLEDKGIKYNYVVDEGKLMTLAEFNNIRSAPIMMIGYKVYDFVAAMQYLRGVA